MRSKLFRDLGVDEFKESRIRAERNVSDAKRALEEAERELELDTFIRSRRVWGFLSPYSRIIRSVAEKIYGRRIVDVDLPRQYRWALRKNLKRGGFVAESGSLRRIILSDETGRNQVTLDPVKFAVPTREFASRVRKDLREYRDKEKSKIEALAEAGAALAAAEKKLKIAKNNIRRD